MNFGSLLKAAPIIRSGLLFISGRIALSLVLLLPLSASMSAEAGQVRLRIIGTISFPDGNPDTVPQLGPDNMMIQARVRCGTGAWILTVIADDDLRDGTATIPASAVTWQGWPSGRWNNGNLSTTVPFVVGSGSNPTNSVGLCRFYLDNSWDYNVGSYTTTATYTLSSP